MNNADCLLTPHHFTYLGVCYVGDNFYINIPSPTSGNQATGYVGHGVPEPDMFPLISIALGMFAMRLWRFRGR